MLNIMISPATPYAAGSFAGALIAIMGLLLATHREAPWDGLRSRLAPATLGTRLLVGHLAALPLIALAAALIAAGGLPDEANMLLGAFGMGAYLLLGLVWPRRPLVQQQQEARMLRRLTPGFIEFLRVALGSFEAPVDVMRRYVSRPQPRLQPMQTLVTEALALMEAQRTRPFEALRRAARGRTCRELNDVAEALAQAESEGARLDGALAAQQATLHTILHNEFRQQINRRMIYLLLMIAVSLVIGVLLNLLFIMTGGGRLLMGGM